MNPAPRIRAHTRLTPVLCVALLMVACSVPRASPPPSTDIASRLTPVASIQELMQAEVDPSADAIWDGVGTITTASGVEERQPREEKDWKALRQRALVLIEASNLLLIPNRRVAQVPFPSDGPGVLSSQQIEQAITKDRRTFDAFAVLLRTQATQVLAAIDAHDIAALWKDGEALDSACEACHRALWYPSETVPTLPVHPDAPK